MTETPASGAHDRMVVAARLRRALSGERAYWTLPQARGPRLPGDRAARMMLALGGLRQVAPRRRPGVWTAITAARIVARRFLRPGHRPR